MLDNITISGFSKNKLKISIPYLKEWFITIPGYILFFMMLFVPTTYQLVKAVILVICLVIVIVRVFLNYGKTNLHISVFWWTGFYVLIGLIFIFIGVLRGAPGAVRVSTVYAIWSIVFTILISGASKPRIIQGIMRTMVITTVVIGIYSLSYILWSWGWLPSVLYIPINMGQAIGFYDGYIEYNLYNISSLVFLVPFMLAVLLTWPKKLKPFGLSWGLLWLAFILGIILVLLSGRRALMLVIFFPPVIIWFLSRFVPGNQRAEKRRVSLPATLSIVVIFVAVGFCLSFAFGISINAIKEMFFEGFNFSNDISALLRAEQLAALLDGWKQYPILGAGHGAGVDYLRSGTQVWAYELSYVALFYQTGAVGFILYFLCFFWIFWKGIRVIKSRSSLGPSMLTVLTGMICFLIANATNPYLAKFDYMWIIFLPLLLINQALLNKDIS